MLSPFVQCHLFHPIIILFGWKSICWTKKIANSLNKQAKLQTIVKICTQSLASTLATLQVGIFLYHVCKEIVLPFHEILSVADNLFGTQTVIFCQRYKGQMKMGRFLVHADYRRNDIFPAHTVNENIACPLEISAFRLDDVEVVFASAGVNVGIAGILFFLSFVMALQCSCKSALVFFKS